LLLLLAFASISFFRNTKLSDVNQGNTLQAAVTPAHKVVNEKSNRALTREKFEDSITLLYDEIQLASYGLDYEIFRWGMVGYYSLKHEGILNNKDIITIIDFSKPSTEKRFYTIDLKNQNVTYHTYVAHGRNTGENMATQFSNTPHSNQSSLGFYVTGETYVGSKGYSLRLDGKDKTYNDKIRSRAVVIHEAAYVSEYWIKRYGRLGRSQGCPALPKKISREVINTIKDNTAIFAYYPDENYLSSSQYLNVEGLVDKLAERAIQLVNQPGKIQS
jgi:hypothetical protein